MLTNDQISYPVGQVPGINEYLYILRVIIYVDIQYIVRPLTLLTEAVEYVHIIVSNIQTDICDVKSTCCNQNRGSLELTPHSPVSSQQLQPLSTVSRAT